MPGIARQFEPQITWTGGASSKDIRKVK